MKSVLFTTAVLGVLLWMQMAGAEVGQWRLGGPEGLDWEEQTLLNLMVDPTTVPGAIQPLELRPEVNVVTQLHHWTRYREPIDIHYRGGMPRVWRAIGNISRPGHIANPVDFIDGDLNTFFAQRDYLVSGAEGGYLGEFYTLDMGLQIPAERFVLVPPEGKDPFFQEPYRPNYAFKQYELTASNDQVLVETQLPNPVGYYQPLDILLASVDQNFDAVIEVQFPLQYLRFFRIQLPPDVYAPSVIYSRYALAELEVYGRGFVPRAQWQSQVIDLQQIVNVGQVRFGASRWRRQDDQLVPAPEAPAGVKVQIKTGLDDTPIAYHSYNDMAQPVEVSEAEYERIKPRVWPWDPPAVGWQGPIVDDTHSWSFWSPPLRQSGQRPRVPKGRYLQVQVELATEALWEYARLDSLVIETSPLLAERVLGEVAVVGDLQPAGNVAQVPAGTPVAFVYDLRAEFAGVDQSGFDAVRLLLPSPGVVRGLAMGEPLATVKPDSVEDGTQELVVYLPERIHPQGAQRLRLRLETAVYGASGELSAEVFAREEATLPQEVEGGDVGEDIGTNQLRVVATAASLGAVLGDVQVHPAVFTPQGDGVNKEVEIRYTLFRVLAQAEVEVEVFSLGGQRVRRLWSESQGAGRYRVRWEGLDDGGRLVAPGIYLVRVGVDTDEGRLQRLRTVAVVY